MTKHPSPSKAAAVAALPRRPRRRRQDQAHHSDRWLVSYADLITLLFALFVVLYAAADHERAQAVANAIAVQFGEAEAARPAALVQGSGVLPGSPTISGARQAVEKAFAAHAELRSNTAVSPTKGGLVISLVDAGFFAEGEAVLRPEAISMVDALADSLRDSETMIRVEGHTDSTPIATARFPSNWELSTARASAVLAELIARGLPSSRLSVAGYAGERPVADNATPEGRARNRRVDLVVLE